MADQDRDLEDGRTAQDLRDEIARLRLLRSITEEFGTSLDFDELLPKVFNAVLDAVNARRGSLWIAEGDVLRCRRALGAASQKLLDTTVPIGEGFVGARVLLRRRHPAVPAGRDGRGRGDRRAVQHAGRAVVGNTKTHPRGLLL